MGAAPITAPRIAAALLGLALLFRTAKGFADYDEDVPAPAVPDDEGRLRGADLQRDLPGFEATPEPPSLRLTPSLQLRIPYQFIGFGAWVEAMPVSWLRLAALYSIGMTVESDELAVSHYAEALLGIRLLRFDEESRVDIPLKKPASFVKDPPAIKAWVPSFHGVYLEGGAVTGFWSFETCGEGNCPEERPAPDNRQMVFLAGGLRYVYHYDIRSAKRRLGKRSMFQLYAHVLAPPFNAPEGPRYFPNGDQIDTSGFGGRIGAEIPAFGTCLLEVATGISCATVSLTLGYAPAPRFAIAEVLLGYPIQ
jgi:hypothetical protein